MKKNTILWIGIAILLGVIAFVVSTNNSGSTLEFNERDFAVKDTGSITKIFMADKKGNHVTLLRKNKDWELENGAATKKQAVNILLETMNRVAVRNPVSKSAYERVIKLLATNSVKVEIYQNGKTKPSKIYYVGPPNQNHDGTYMLIEGASKPFVMHIEGFHGFLTPRYFVDSTEWESNEVFNYNLGDIKKLEVKYPMDEEQSFQIVAEENNRYNLKTINGEDVNNFSAQKIVQYIALYQDMNYESFEKTKSSTFIDSVKTSIPYKIITVTEDSGKNQQVKFYKKPMKQGAINLEGEEITHDQDRMYLLINEERFVVAQYFVFEKIDGTLNSFLLRE